MAHMPVVTVNNQRVTCKWDNNRIESVAWDDLKTVHIHTTSGGPFNIDLFWVLADNDTRCVVPLGSVGEDELVNKLQSLKGFNNQAMIDATASVDEAWFLCWEKP